MVRQSRCVRPSRARFLSETAIAKYAGTTFNRTAAFSKLGLGECAVNTSAVGAGERNPW